MALIKGRKLAQDPWKLLEGSEGELPSIPATGNVIVPLAAWRALREQLISRADGVGVVLSATDDPADIAADLKHLQLVAVNFATFNDGRGYSTARLLRERYGWRGELRAVGDVLRDQLFPLARCGFDAFQLKEGADIDEALAAFDDFSEAYQASVDRPLPLFRRREAAAATRTS
jgi:uncharacterized protein (DUF934 family)